MALLLTVASKFNDKGVKQAERSFKRLTHSMRGAVGGALGALGLGMGVRQLFDMAKAADEDAKSAKLLADQLKRMTGATTAQVTSSEAFIQKLALQTGIIDDQLRPSLTELAAGTKDVGKAQELLVAVLDIAKGRGKSVEAVQKAVSKAYSGNTTALQRMFPEMKKTADKFKESKGHALTFKESLELGRDMINQLGEANKNQAANMATPFDKMNIAMDNLKEGIGEKIMPALVGFVDYLTGTALPKVYEFLDVVSNPTSELGASFSYLWENLKDLNDEIGNVFAAFSNDGTALSGFAIFANGIGDIISMISMKMQHFAKMVQAIRRLDWATAISEGNAITGVAGNVTDYMQTQQNKANAKGAALDKIYNNAARNSGVTININGVVGDKVAVGKAVREALDAYDKNNGRK